MIVKKRFEAKVSNINGRTPFWVKGVAPTNTPSDEKALAVFQPDVLIPTQYLDTYRRHFHLEPERTLMLAVLQDAVVCFQENLAATCKKKQSLYFDAEKWIFNSDQSYLFSFDNVCDALGYDTSYMRQGLRRWKEAALENRCGKDSRKRLAS